MFKLIGTVISLMIGIACYYLLMPVWSLDYPLTILVLMATIYPVVAIYFGSIDRFEISPSVTLAFVGVYGLYLIGAAMVSNPVMNADRYKNLIGKIEHSDYKKALPPIDIKNVPLVSEDMAHQVAQKKLSDIPALGSQVELGKFVKQSVNGKLYWISFLEHTGAWQWSSTGSTPGYMKVSATNPEDVTFVTEVDGKKLQMKYLLSAFLGDYALRRLYSEGRKSVGRMDFSSEIDDKGMPYIVATVFDKKIGISGEEAIGVDILDVQTGVVKSYSKEEAPAWVDRIYPEEMVKDQVSDWGLYMNGWLNPSKKGQVKVSGETDFVYGSDGHCYIYMGITSVGSDNGIIGFILVNSRTKETKYYLLPGAQESVAAKAAENALPEKNYHATSPLPFSVNGLPTYIMALVDSNGVPRAYAMVDIQDYQISAVADTMLNTYQLYERKLNKRGGLNIDEKSKAGVSLSGIVQRISSEVKNNNTVFYLTISGSTQIFMGTSEIGEKLVLTKPMDQVLIKFNESNNKIVNLNSFENVSIK